MNTRQIVLLVLGSLALVGAFLALTTDVFAHGVNCGTGLVRRNTDALILETGDFAEDDFQAEVVRGACGQQIMRSRVITAAAAVAAAGLFVASRRAGQVRDRFPGDPIV